MEGFAGIVAPADGSFPGAGHKLAPTGSLSMEYAPLCRKGLGAAESPSSAARFFRPYFFISSRDRPVALHVQGDRAMVRESPFP